MRSILQNYGLPNDSEQRKEIKMDKYENNFEMTEGLYVEVIKKMVPGATLAYSSQVVVKANSEDCWLFIKQASRVKSNKNVARHATKPSFVCAILVSQNKGGF